MPDHDDPTPDRVVRVQRLVTAPAEAIFELLADPSKHHLIDGSGTVQGAATVAGERLELGSRFGMKMRFGVPYRITNEVVEFEEGRRIAWRHFGGHVWRWRLDPVDDGTIVTEEFDWRPSRAPWLIELAKYPTRNRESIEATLDRLAARFESDQPASG